MSAKDTWHQSKFTDHYLKSVKPKSNLAWAGDKLWTYCTRCYCRDFTEEREKDMRDLTDGIIQFVRTDEGIRNFLWSQRTSSDAPRTSISPFVQRRKEQQCNHLLHCPNQPQDVREAAAIILRKGWTPQTPMIYLEAPTAAWSQAQDSEPGPSSLTSTSVEHHNGPALGLNVFPSAPAPRHPSPLSISINSLSEQSYPNSPVSPHPPIGGSAITRSVSCSASFDSTNHQMARKRPRVSSTTSEAGRGLRCTEERQTLFEHRITQLTASAGFPLQWVDNPEWLQFLCEFVPDVRSFNRKRLTNELLPREVEQNRQLTISTLQRLPEHLRVCTLQTDGWTAITWHHLLAFVITTTNRETHTVKVKDVSDVSTTVVVCVTSDASGESRKARKLLVRKRPELVAPDCQSHQVNLVVGEYLKDEQTFTTTSEQANDLIAWLRSRIILLGKLRKIQINILRKSSALSPVRPGITRWTSHYLAMRRLLEIREELQVLALDSTIVRGRPAQVAKSQEMVNLIQSPSFWHALIRIKRHLEPLAVAANVSQSSHCRFDQVVLMFAVLVFRYQNLNDPEDQSARETILNSIEKRWAKVDQDVFIAAVLLHPLHKNLPFSRGRFTVTAVLDLVRRLWRRFYKEDPPSSLDDDVRDYLFNAGDYASFAPEHENMKNILKNVNQQRCGVDPIRLYADLIEPGLPPQSLKPVQRLAVRILSMCANSASCERLFSLYGRILTKLRSRMRPEVTEMLAELNMFVHNEHLREGRVKERVKTHILGQRRPPTTPSTSSNEIDELEDDTLPPTRILPQACAPASEIANHLRTMVDADDDDQVEIDGEAVEFPSVLSVPLSKLFNFEKSYWINLQEQVGKMGLEEEMELYQLLDLDANGDVDNGEGVDEQGVNILV